MSEIPSADEMVEINQPEKESNFKLGTVAALFTSKTAKVKFDGEDSASEKQYAYLSSYSPTVGDRVLLAAISGTYIILGGINYSVPPTAFFTLDNGTLKTNYNIELKGWIDVLNTSGINVLNGIRIAGPLRHQGTTVSFFNKADAVQRTCATLGGTATLANVISKVNEIIGDLQAYGLYK